MSLTPAVGQQMLLRGIATNGYGHQGMWIKGTDLSRYRNRPNSPYPPSPNNGRDWQEIEKRLRAAGVILKYKNPGGQTAYVFYVLPRHRRAFKIAHPNTHRVP